MTCGRTEMEVIHPSLCSLTFKCFFILSHILFSEPVSWAGDWGNYFIGVLFLSPGLSPVGVGWGVKTGFLQASILSSSFHFYKKPLHEAIHQFVVWYHQCNDVTQWYHLTPGQPVEVVKLPFKRLENIWVLMGRNHQSRLLSRMGIAPSEEYEFCYCPAWASLFLEICSIIVG